jgi:zinc transport system permease protein
MLEVLSLAFVQRAFIAGIIIAFLGSYYGVFVVQRKISFIGDGLAHAAFGGVALGLLLNTEPLIIAIPFTIIVSLLITYLKDKTDLSSDTSIGILFAVSVALGIVFLSFQKNFSTDAFSYLFGSILSVTKSDLIIAGTIAVLTIFTFKNLWSEWAFATFDEELSQTDRIKNKRNDYILSILLSLSIVVSIKIVGIVLISAFLVIPPASSRLISSRFYQMTIYSIVISVLTVVIGLLASFALNLPSGAIIILSQAAIFIIIFIIRLILKR